MRFYPNQPDRTHRVRWYFVCDAPTLSYHTPFRSRQIDRGEEQESLGEVRGTARWSRGVPPAKFDRDTPCGPRRIWESGAGPDDAPLERDPETGLPVCCGPDVLPTTVCRGGVGYGGRCLTESVQAGLVLGGQLGEITGGLAFGGSLSPFLGGIALAGSAGDSVGGLAFGGTAGPGTPPGPPGPTSSCQLTGPTAPELTWIPYVVGGPTLQWWRIGSVTGPTTVLVSHRRTAGTSTNTLWVANGCVVTHSNTGVSGTISVNVGSGVTVNLQVLMQPGNPASYAGEWLWRYL